MKKLGCVIKLPGLSKHGAQSCCASTPPAGRAVVLLQHGVEGCNICALALLPFVPAEE